MNAICIQVYEAFELKEDRSKTSVLATPFGNNFRSTSCTVFAGGSLQKKSDYSKLLSTEM